MKEYKTFLQKAVQKLIDVNPRYSRYFRYARDLGEGLLSMLYTTPKNRDPYYDRKTRRDGNLDYGDSIPPGTGYPQLKPVGSYI